MDSFENNNLVETITRIYSQSDNIAMANNLVCEAISKNIAESASVAILMYQGISDALVCKGRYLDMDASKVACESCYEKILEQYNLYDFIYCYSVNKEQKFKKDLFKRYIDLTETDTVSEEYFKELYENSEEWISNFEEVKAAFEEEIYPVDNQEGKNKTISGSYFYELIHKKSKERNLKYKDLKDADVITENNLCFKHLRKRGIEITDEVHYLAIPIRSKYRYFGLLRILIPRKDCNIRKFKLEKSSQLINITNILSLQLEFLKYKSRYRNVLNQKIDTVVDLKTDIKPFLEKYCDNLSDIVNCRGAVVRLGSKPNRIRAASKDINYYLDDLDEAFREQLEEEEHSAITHYKRVEKGNERSLIAIYVKNCRTYPLKIRRFYTLEKEETNEIKIYAEEGEWGTEEGVPNIVDNSMYSEICNKYKIGNYIIFRVPGSKNQFFTFFNSENRIFTYYDVEILYNRLRSIGFTLQEHFKKKAQKLREITQNIQTKVENLLAFSNVKEEVLENPFKQNSLPIYELKKLFYQTIYDEIKNYELFQDCIIWECVSDVVPSEYRGDELEYKFLQVYPRGTLSEFHEIKKVKISKNDFNYKKNNYFNRELSQQLISNLDEYIKEDQGHFDIPIFTKPFATKDDENPSLNSLLSIIYDKNLINGRFQGFVDTEEFANIIFQLGVQIAILTDKLVAVSAKIIKDRVDKEDVLTNPNSNKGIKLHGISQIIAKELNSDLCLFYLKNIDEKEIEMIASNLDDFKLPSYSIINNEINEGKEPLTKLAYLRHENYRLTGRKTVLKHTVNERLLKIEEGFLIHPKTKNKLRKRTVVEHWMVSPIQLRKDQIVGLTKLLRIPSHVGNVDEQIQSKPFSEFENNVLRKTLKNLFHLIEDYFIIGLREKVIRNVVHQVVTPLNALVMQCKDITEEINHRFANKRKYRYSYETNEFFKDIKFFDKLNYVFIQAKLAAERSRSFETLLALEEDNLSRILRKKKTNINHELIKKAIDYQPYARREKGIKIHVKKSGEDIFGFIDRRLFNHVVTGLIENAIKYSLSRSHRKKKGFCVNPMNDLDIENIIINLYKFEGQLILTVSNIGVEILEAERERILKRGVRGINADTYTLSGNGIGLYLCEQIIEKVFDGTIFLKRLLYSEDEEFLKKHHIVFQVEIPLENLNITN